jgi:hypothetical protein
MQSFIIKLVHSCRKHKSHRQKSVAKHEVLRRNDCTCILLIACIYKQEGLKALRRKRTLHSSDLVRVADSPQ